MRLSSIVTSSAVLAALFTMLMGGCGGGATLGDEGSDPSLRDEELNGGAASGDPQGKITICHVPPGNPANARTLVVGGPAWNGHSHHKGDYLGACQGQGGPDAGVPPTNDGGTPQPDAGTPPPPPPPPPPADGGTPGPTCAPLGAACGGGVVCCAGLQCYDGYCQDVIN